ncbi:MAG: FtsX-like permease family protein [Vicinamibacterales bacterium]
MPWIPGSIVPSRTRSARTAGGLLLSGLLLALGRLLAAQADPAPPVELPTVLASRQLLAARHLAVGDVVSLSTDPSGASPREFRIIGVYEPMADPIRLNSERYEVRLHLPDLLDLTADGAGDLRADAVSAINVGLVDPAEAAAFARDVAARVPTIAARSSRNTGGGNPFVVLGRFHLAIAILTVTTSAVFLLALMVLLADERREVIGALRLMGFTRARVLAQVLLEGAAIAGAGAAFGVLLAAVTQGAFNGYFQWKYDTALVFVRVTPEIAWQSVAMALPLGIAANLVASWALVRSDTLGLVRR